GFLVAGGFYPTFAHQETHVEQFLEACEPVFQELAEAIQKGDIEPRIGGPVKHTGFRRLV
ncbi:MAG: aminotransferase class III, partial [Candidatus Aminicenantes bacterium]|nr:aminotransferase class III [Candidatus Aminicenantes bacterium]